MTDLLAVRLFDCRTIAERDRGIRAAIDAIGSGDLVVLPTDTVYGIGADAFKPWSVTNLLNARGGQQVAPPVLVGSRHTLDGLVTRMPPAARDLVEAFWPGALTIIVEQSPTLQWELGDTGGTVAVRMPLHPVALEVLRATGPMAVTTANATGNPAPATATEAREQLSYKVSVYLEAGQCPSPVPSTIVDVTGDRPKLIRAGAITAEQVREVVGLLEEPS
jgi:tRNA threonylcarbamoyl adenosine modification protein (Sua5/YciO/YrdC/YwlC family)